MNNFNGLSELSLYNLPIAIKNGAQFREKINDQVTYIDDLEQDLKKYQSIIEVEDNGVIISAPVLYDGKQINIFCNNGETVDFINSYYNLLYGEQLIGLDARDVIDATLKSTSGQFIMLHTTMQAWEENLDKELSNRIIKKCNRVLFNIEGDIGLADINLVANYLDEYFNKEATIFAQGNYDDVIQEGVCTIYLWILS